MYIAFKAGLSVFAGTLEGLAEPLGVEVVRTPETEGGGWTVVVKHKPYVSTTEADLVLTHWPEEWTYGEVVCDFLLHYSAKYMLDTQIFRAERVN